MRKVAVTGGFASGKSSVCEILARYGAYVVSADEIVHQLLSKDTAISRRVARLLGPDVFSNGRVDRKKVADAVFTDRERLKELEAILHPAVYEEIKKQYDQVKHRSQYRLFVAEVPLLYESGEEAGFFDIVAAVVADEETCRQRVRSEQEYSKRMQRQLTQQEKADRADIVIDNSGDPEQLKNNVLTLFSKELHPQ